MNRQEYNFKLLDAIRSLIKEYPDQRFGQLLFNSQIVRRGVDPFFEESQAMFERCFPTPLPTEYMVEKLSPYYEFRKNTMNGLHTVEIFNLSDTDDYRKFTSSSEERADAFLYRSIITLFKKLEEESQVSTTENSN